ncbi:4-phosphoerythronate dehydrogenase [Colwellia psychrerythraea]|uniref:Erythronate-4-phosphate dehydrogenase n=1 Tax=Colwellia psychrerythraea (strain 34H / ATCC BAA-681) TaxID=167879 RepID=PDXB_COLP3|nr:4-phosphoerythronate dehydrogenase [Colwellia psychrerythraea]Q47XK1.1 RecName: Full=Erythronate-4-phosphate dehydrogenase [Colwellia psychrerythraea 34H]AAZ25306.1 erythronate-4-phosphate dehydrogenase [Colwellia psychrerythraea 34H]
MKIYFDENMPFAKEFFSELCHLNNGIDGEEQGELVPFSGRTLTAAQVADADVLLVRSITQVNEQLLHLNDKISFVGSATIGTDHIDLSYLAKRNITFQSAPGCNAISVAEYVLSALVVLAERYLLTLSSLTVGIVGGGNTGTRLSEKLTALGIQHKICDPLLAEKQKQDKSHPPTDQRHYVPLVDVLACDVISLHVPKVVGGEHPTNKLINAENLALLREDQILISACRGDVIDNHALLALKTAGHGVKIVLDVWQGEPDVLEALIPYTEIATAHIAGYSLEGKARGSEMLYQALCQQLAITPKYQLANFLPSASIPAIEINQDFNQILLNQLVKMVYDVRRDDAIFRQQLFVQGFDSLRKNYPVRREFSAVTVNLSSTTYSDVPHRLGFNKN